MSRPLQLYDAKYKLCLEWVKAEFAVLPRFSGIMGGLRHAAAWRGRETEFRGPGFPNGVWEPGGQGCAACGLADAAKLQAAGQAREPMSTGPLADILVIDLTRVLAGPFCTMLLAELGARVIKVENPAGGDDSRRFEPILDGQSAYFASLNRGKESIALDLKDPADQNVFLALVRRGDVLVENFRPGTLERLGFGYERLRQENPRLIYAAVSGFGHTGPWSPKPAYDMIVQAQGGLMSVTGQPGGRPTKAGTSIGDITGGLFTVIGIAAALYH